MRTALGLEYSDVTEELEGVSEALFGHQQQGPPGQRFAAEAWQIGHRRMARDAQTCFIGGPAALEITLCQIAFSQAVFRLGMIWHQSHHVPEPLFRFV